MSNETKPKTRFVDIPELSETFADSVRSINYDSQSMRIEFCTTRLDDPKPPNPQTRRQYPSCRLVLTPNAALDLSNKLQNLLAAMENQGIIKRDTPTGKETKH